MLSNHERKIRAGLAWAWLALLLSLAAPLLHDLNHPLHAPSVGEQRQAPDQNAPQPEPHDDTCILCHALTGFGPALTAQAMSFAALFVAVTVSYADIAPVRVSFPAGTARARGPPQTV